MRATCDCGNEMYIHKGYLPEYGESVIWLCDRCGKEWELYYGRSGVSISEVRKDKKK